MHRSALFLLASAAVAPAAHALRHYCGDACGELVYAGQYDFGECPEDDSSCSLLTNQAYLGTIALCIEDHCEGDNDEWKSAITWVGVVDEQKSLLDDDYTIILNNATAFASTPANHEGEVLRVPVSTSHDDFMTAWKSVWAVTGAKDWYTAVMSYVLLILALAVVVPASLHYFFLRGRSQRTMSEEAVQKSPAWRVWPQKWLMLPPLFKKHNAHRPSFLGFSVSIPTRFETFCIICYLLVNALGCGLGIVVIRNNLIYPDDSVYMVRAVADKAGRMCIYNLPLLVLFAGRNNALIWATGIPFATFNLFHRMIGRVVALEGILHSCLYLARLGAQKKKDLPHWIKLSVYAQWGILAGVCGVVIIVQGTHTFRRRAYETFLILHIILALFFIVGAWKHLRLQGEGDRIPWEPGWPSLMHWMAAAVALWAFDRLVRVARVAYYNFRWTKEDGWRMTKADIRPLSGGFVELSIKLAHDWTFVPGQYCFVHLPSGLRYMQSHPFTVLSYDSSAFPTEDEKSIDSPSEKMTEAVNSPERSVKMVIRPQKGITSTLMRNNEERKNVKVFVEGPYGAPFSLPTNCYDNVTFVSGGIGFTAIWPHVRPALYQQHKQLHWVCILRTVEEVRGLEPLLAQVAQHPHLRVSLYITGENESSKALEAASFAADEVHWQKPQVQNVLARDAETSGSLAVVSCGPGRLLDDVRAGVTDLTSTHRAPIELYSEGFEW